MNQRFSLDVNSFQKLLAAAWVVQSQRDAGIDPKQTKELMRSNAELASAIRQAISHRKPEKTAPRTPGSQICIAVPNVTRRVPRTVPVYAQAHTAGSLALAQEQATAPAVESMAAPGLVVVEKPETQRATAPQEQSAGIAAKVESPVKAGLNEESQAIQALHTASAIPETRLIRQPNSVKVYREALRERVAALVNAGRQWIDQIQVRGRFEWIRFPRMGFAWRPGAGPIYAGSLAVLLITGNFLFSLLTRSQPNLRQTTQASRAAVESWHDQVTRNEVRPAQVKVDPPPSAPALEASHLRVTDENASSAVEALSRFEISELQRRAKYGDYVAALTLGMAYEVGQPVRQSCSEATRWIAIAAEEGSPAAQYNLALRYQQGDGTAMNLEEAKKWMGRAASRGYEKARAANDAVASAATVSAGGQ